MPLNLASGRGELSVPKTPTLSANVRAKLFVAEFLDKAEKGQAAEKVFDAIMAGMTAETTVRAPNTPAAVGAPAARGYGYAWTPDHAIRLTAARLLAEIMGLLPKGNNVNIDVSDNSVKVTVHQRLAELEAIGVKPEDLLAEMRGVMKRADAILPEKPAARSVTSP